MKRLFHLLLGDRGERAAVRYLKQHGFKIVATQYRSPAGEIDIIAMEQGKVVFIEVKTRKSVESGQPHEAVDLNKQRKLTKLALLWLKKHKRLDQGARFDVVSIVWPDGAKEPEITHFRNAFEATGSGQFYS